MRLWHYELIPYLPDSQLRAQWRELNSIFKNQPKHILINYVYEYSKEDLFVYSTKVLKEFEKRGFKYNLENYQKYLFDNSTLADYPYSGDGGYDNFIPFVKHHNNRYLIQCYFNLQEKCDRGQKDFSNEQMIKLIDFIGERLKLDLEVIDK